MLDWGKIYESSDRFCVAAPSGSDEIRGLLRASSELNVSIRVRGRGHSMNGSSLPRDGELLLLTQNIRHFAWKSPDEISVGGGISVFAVQEWLKKHNASLPIFNDGVLGPSVGGYISASGIGTRSALYGGFWENVTYIDLIDATGKAHHIERSDPIFRWIFGSMGQLGLIYEAGLRVIPAPGTPFKPQSGLIAEEWENSPDAAARKKEFETSRLTWFTLIAPSERSAELSADLKEIKIRYQRVMSFLPDYTWPIRRREFTPPLFYPEHRDLTCIGIWGYGNPTDKNLNDGILEINSAVFALLERKKYYKRYIQAEPAGIVTPWANYFGEKTIAEFARLRKIFNPRSNFNENCVFDCDDPGRYAPHRHP